MKLLIHYLNTHNIPYKHLLIRLNRNDSAKNGITRKQLLKDGMPDEANSIVVYIDEWISGVNFNKIISILSKVKTVTLFPFAFIEGHAFDAIDFRKFEIKHDSICKKIGKSAEDLRVVMPFLNGANLITKQPFIWSEFDRGAGYIKMI